MSYASATGVQRLAVQTAAHKLALGTAAARYGLNPTGVVNDAPIATLAADMQAALTAVGEGLVATQAVVSNGGTAPVKNSAGTAVPGTSTYEVAANAVSAVKLPATVAPVVSGVLAGIVATGTGTTVTLTVANGVVTAVALS